MLKAKICERFDFPNLFDEDDKSSIHGIGEIRKALKIHNLYALLIYSGLRKKLEVEKGRNKEIARVNSLLFNNWSENIRYKSCNCLSSKDVEELIKLLKHNNGLLRWIEQN